MPRIRGHLSAAFASYNYCGRHHVSQLKCNGQLPLRMDSTYKKHRFRPLDYTYRSRSTHLFMSDDHNDGGEIINIPQMKKTVTRLSLRTVKKIGKASVRLKATQDRLAKARAAIEENQEVDDALLEQLEQAPSETTLKEYENDLSYLQTRLQKLNWLEEQFNTPPLKKKGDLTSDQLLELTDVGEQILQYTQELEINENEAAKQKRVEEDAKNKRSKKEMSYQKQQQQQVEGSRLPYRRYYTEGNVEIKVGKQATDNDVLSLSPEHRSGSHWWYHASGCPGSHVVLCTDDPSPSEEAIKDAASLAALKSKCIGQSVIKVSMTRARNVSKPPGAKPGLVQLNGEVRTITLRKDEVEKRCERLEKTVLVN
eukprot:scaffold14253_cov72-Cyclotella_meneghiniana.AAC.2